MEIKQVKDYYEPMYEKYPDVPKEDIRRILNYGWKSLYLHNTYGGDTIIKDSNFWFYIGNLKKSSLKYFNYYIKKLIIKIKVLYKRLKIEWDGYYYFALNDKQYEDYCSQLKAKGRKRKHYIFKDVYLYEIYDECSLTNQTCKYIFRVPYISYINRKFKLDELKTDKAELIKVRNPLRFLDVLVTNNKYIYEKR